jgi:hypothetical protein
MSLIDISYFVGVLNIPNTNDSTISAIVNYYISKYEQEFLKQLMGYPLYKAYQADLDNSGDPKDSRFTDILNGAEFTNLNSGEINKWDGLIQEISSTPLIKKSIIGNYIYYKYRIENATFFTGTSENTNNGETTPATTLRRRLSLVWNEINSAVNTFIAFIDANQAVYPEWTYTDKIRTLQFFDFMNPIF